MVDLEYRSMQNVKRAKSKRFAFAFLLVTTSIIFIYFLLISTLRPIPERIVLAISFSVSYATITGGALWISLNRSPSRVQISPNELKLFFRQKEKILPWSEIETIWNFGIIILKDGRKVRLAYISKEIIFEIVKRLHESKDRNDSMESVLKQIN